MAENTQNNAPKKRFWRLTSRRAADYAEQYKLGVHIGGKKDGQELTEGEKGKMYNKAKNAGADKDEAAAYSQIIGKGGEEILEKAKKRKKN